MDTQAHTRVHTRLHAHMNEITQCQPWLWYGDVVSASVALWAVMQQELKNTWHCHTRVQKW